MKEIAALRDLLGNKVTEFEYKLKKADVDSIPQMNHLKKQLEALSEEA